MAWSKAQRARHDAKQKRFYAEERERWDKIHKAEDEWYKENRVYSYNYGGVDGENVFKRDIREILTCRLSRCVYCSKLLGEGRHHHIRRWHRKHASIGYNVEERRVEDSLNGIRHDTHPAFKDYEPDICIGCGNTEYAIGKVIVECEELVAQLSREAHAQTH